MSINVTVSGNPVSIKRGKMVTWDPCVCTKEFEKRRLMRLEQVRQQSKGIAEDVRNKVRKEKEKQLGETEKRGKENLKNWQNRKLLELQNQYKEALKDIGMGHKEAELMADESDVLIENNERNKKIAKQRATAAASKLQADKNEEYVKKKAPLENKKLVRSIENARAELVSTLKTTKSKPGVTKCKKKQPSADIHISVPSGSSSSLDEGHYNAGNTSTRSDIQSMPNISEEYQLNLESSNSSAQCTSSERECVTESKKCRTETLSSDLHQPSEKISDERSPKPSDLYQQRDSYAQMLESHKKLIETFREKVNVETSEDTRISDRIKQRQVMASKPDYCDYASVNPIPDINIAPHKPVFHPVISATDSHDNHAVKCTCNCAACEQLTQKLNSQNASVEPHASSSKMKEPAISSKYISEGKNLPTENSRQGSDINISRQFQQSSSKTSYEISSKPSVKLKGLNVKEQLSEKSTKSGTSEASNMVHYYDHSSKFSSERDSRKAANVEKIDSTSIEVIPNLVSETEMREKMKQRDKDAQARGRKAMEKEKLRKDYEEMMKKLPVLQKKERIRDMYKDKPEYHMSEDRLRELERKRQNDLENAFIKEFPGLKPAIVTLPSNKDNNASKATPKMETQEPVTSSHVPKWDVDFESPKMFSMEEVKEILEVFTGQSEVDRRKKLKKLIKSLKMQEEQLLNEIRNLPQDDSTRELINDLSALVHKDNKKRKPKEKRKRRRESNDSSLEESSSSVSSQTQSSKGRKDKTSRSRRGHTHKTPSPRKKVKIKREILVLQNTSTQTTPKPPTKDDDAEIKNKADTHESIPKSPRIDNICNKLHVRCDCHLNKQNQPQEELCEIFIKLNDNDIPEVVVKSKDQETGKISSRKTSDTDIRESPRKSPEKISPKRDEKERPISAEKQIKQVKPSVGGPEPSAQTRIMPEKKRHHSEPKAKSWKEQLSKNSISTSSTSYMSPPDFTNVKGSTLTSSCYDSTKESLSSTRKRSHQRNVTHLTAVSVSQTSLGSEHMDSRLLNYIRKLVSMSRTSIDELGVSSSDVPTPSQSIIEMETNNPLAHLQNVVKYINLNPEEVMKELSYSADDIPQNGSITASSGKEVSRQILAERKGSTRSNEKILNQYADITDTCSKRIANLAAMIDKLREEKVRMLQTSPIGDEIDKPKTISPGNSEKDFSTAYLDLPNPSEKSKEGSKASSERSLDEEELTRKLLEIDTSLASKLRNFPSTSIQPGSDSSGPKEDDMDSVERDLYKRLKKLRETTDLPENNVEQPASTSSTAQFVPFLTDIPRLPKLEALPEDHVSQTSISNLRKRPPPSKGLTTARKFNGDISLVPHELSTIVEADSQISTKITPSSTKNSPSKDQFVELVVVPENQDKQRTSSDKSTDRSIPQISPEISIETRNRCDDRTCDALKNLKEKSQGSSSSRTEIQSSNILSSSSSDDIEAIESMLKSIGMDWAISTLHKTREALQMTSTSSSSDPSKSRPANVSDVSLSQFLKGHVLSDGTSSILEFSDLSGLQNSSSAEKGNRRTSTPIFSSKNLTRCSEKKCKFAEESDISSVKQSSKGSDKYSFHSLSDASLSRTNN